MANLILYISIGVSVVAAVVVHILARKGKLGLEDDYEAEYDKD